MDLFRQKTTEIIKEIRKFLKNEKQLLLLIFIFGLVLRLTGLVNIQLAGDNLTHWKIAGEIATKGILPLLGPRASITGNFNLGPFYYYFLSIPYWLGRGDFRMAIIFVAILNSISILLLYLVAKRWFSGMQSLRISFLFACSAYFIQIQSFPWNPYLLPLFIIISLYFINKVNEGKYLNLFFLAVSYAVCLQLHATAIFLLPVFLYILPLRKIPLKYYLFGVITLLVANSPWIWANLTTNFSQIKAIFIIFNQGAVQQCSLSSWLTSHGNGERCFWYFRNTLFVFRFFGASIFNVNNIIFGLVGLLITLFYFLKTGFKEYRFLLVWIVTVIVLFLLYSNVIYLHYFLILTPVPFLLLVIVLEKLAKRKGNWIYLANGLYLLVILFNLCQYVWSLQFTRG